MSKLIWIELSTQGRFAYDESRIFAEASAFILTGNSIKYLCAILNSSLIQWFFQSIAPTSGMGVLRWKKTYIQQIPVPRLSSDECFSIVSLVDRILRSKEDTFPSTKTFGIESEIDQRIYELYGLTTAEKEMVTSLKKRGII